MEEKELLQERFALARERVLELSAENELEQKEWKNYFTAQFQFLALLSEQWDWIAGGGLQNSPLTVLAENNAALYENILPSQYADSFCNPQTAVRQLGDYGQLMACAAAEMRAAIPAVYEQKTEAFLIRLELMLCLYSCFEETGQLPEISEIRELLYWYFSDYLEDTMTVRIAEQVDPELSVLAKMLCGAETEPERALYLSGEYVTENERRLSAYLQALPQERIDLIAGTFTEGYRIGFEVTRKDLSKKKTVELYYRVGFERVIRRAIENFAAMGLRPTVVRTPASLLEDKKQRRRGFYGALANPQFDFDHREDLALFLDKNLLQRKVESLQAAFEANREAAALYAGPAVAETFGEADFTPQPKAQAPSYSEKQRREMVTYTARAGEITNTFIPGEERSFTIIAFPVPDIGAHFPEIFDETIRINTLDYALYCRIQQKLIDALDEAAYVLIRGMGNNRTSMKVMLHPLTDPARQTNFENCVADVNIPVGEVFTSPLLTGTQGRLHVTNVFLEGLHYRDLELEFRDGMITSYSCSNYTSEEENRRLIREHILFQHDSLPLGEFAIGTNTTAYAAARRLGIMDKMPILIAEKMGPHFAVGDTCYSHEEDGKTYNPDGKEIIARENEVSAKRHTAPQEAYFNCHTDITIPYDELGEISIVRPDESVTVLLENGQFVLPGCEELNEPLQG